MKREESHVWVTAETGVEEGVPRNGGTYMRARIRTWFGYFLRSRSARKLMSIK